MIREARAVLLLLLGNAILSLALRGDHVDYVKPVMRWPLVAAGALTALLGLTQLISVLRAPKGKQIREHATGGNLGHDHGHGPRVAWLLVAPVFAILVIAPPPLGSFAAARDDGTVAQPTDSGFPPLPEGVNTLSLTEYSVRAVWDSGLTLTGRQVSMTGFATPAPNGNWYLTRMTLVCCAADAQARKVEIRGVAAPPTDSWVQVLGTFTPSQAAKQQDAIAVLVAEQVTPVETPDDTYE
ncbi:MAG: TIGR03943 family putative permease subunit [Sporichthyaceae bacterium]